MLLIFWINIYIYIYLKNISEVIKYITSSKTSNIYKKNINEFEEYLLFKPNQTKLFYIKYNNSFIINNVLYIIFYEL